MSPQTPQKDRPDRELLTAYTLGKLSDAESQRVAELIDGDPECQAMLGTIDAGEDTLAGNLRRPAADSPSTDGPLQDDPFDAESQCNAAVARAKAVAGRLVDYAVEASEADSLVARELGEYQLLQRLGCGGMGTVYKALHTKLDRLVALKVIARHRMHDSQAAARFGREMMAIGRLTHANIVQAFDAREVGDTPVLIMEYVDGLDLGELIRRHGPISIPDACELARRAALGLQYAHEHALVHRDIKPSNLMLGRDGELKILDLGLARLVDTAAEELPQKPSEESSDEAISDADNSQASASSPDRVVPLTAASQAMGTADYMAPEQVACPQTVDIRADIYSLGCTLYKLLTGQAPFAGGEYTATLTKLAAHQTQTIRPIRELNPDVPTRLAVLIERMLAKSPDDRYAIPAEVAEALEPFTTGHELNSLLEKAESMTPADRTEPATGSTPEPRPAASGGSFRRILTMVAMAFFFGGLGLVAGILITIKQGERETTVAVAPGSKVNVDEKGNVQVTPPGALSQTKKKTLSFGKSDEIPFWKEFGVTPAPVSPMTAKVLEWMGLHLSPITKDRFRDKNVFAKYLGGLDVTSVRTPGPAEKAGIHEVDIVVGLQGRTITGLENLDSAMQVAAEQTKQGDTEMLQFDVLRSGKTVRVSVPFPVRELDLRMPGPISLPVRELDLRMPGPISDSTSVTKLSNSQSQTPAPTAPDRDIIQGTWEIIENQSQVRFPFFPSLVDSAQDETPVEGVDIRITDKHIRIINERGQAAVYRYSINEQAEPKQIDIRDVVRQDNKKENDKKIDLTLGIYELNGGVLKLCLQRVTTRYVDRPTTFWPGLSEKSKLFVLRRTGSVIIPPDEQAVEGRWCVTGLSRKLPIGIIKDSADRAAYLLSQRPMVHFNQYKNNINSDFGLFVFDAAQKPHTFSWGESGSNVTVGTGIWKLEGNNLRLRFCDPNSSANSPVSGFDKAPNVGEAEAYLIREKTDGPDNLAVYVTSVSWGKASDERFWAGGKQLSRPELKQLCEQLAKAGGISKVEVYGLVGSNFHGLTKIASIALDAGVTAVTIIPSKTQQTRLAFHCVVSDAINGQPAISKDEIEQYKRDLKVYGPEPQWGVIHDPNKFEEFPTIWTSGMDVAIQFHKKTNIVVFKSRKLQQLSQDDIAKTLSRAREFGLENTPKEFGNKEPRVVNCSTGDIYPPGSDKPVKPKYGWYPLAGLDSLGLITAEHNGRKFVLLSEQAGEMLPTGDGELKILEANVCKDNRGKPAVEGRLGEADGKAMAMLTTANLKRRLAIVVDDYVVSTPHINGPISTKFQITGNFTIDEVKLLADMLAGRKREIPSEPQPQATTAKGNRKVVPIAPISPTKKEKRIHPDTTSSTKPLRPIPPPPVPGQKAIQSDAYTAATRRPVSPIPSPSVHDRKAIQGAWKIVDNPSQEVFPFFAPKKILDMYSWKKRLSSIPAETTKITITDKFIKIRGEDGISIVCRYSINPDVEPKMIDVEYKGLLVTGIYSLKDGDLKVCLSQIPDEQSRPKTLWPGLSKKSKLLVLRRTGDAVIRPDEKAVEGRWHVTGLSQVIPLDGLKDERGRIDNEDLFLHQLTVAPTLHFENGKEKAACGDTSIMSFDATRTPHTFTWSNFRRGIWKIDGDKLRLRFVGPGNDDGTRQIGGFDQKPTANELDMFLTRAKPDEQDCLTVFVRYNPDDATKSIAEFWIGGNRQSALSLKVLCEKLAKKSKKSRVVVQGMARSNYRLLAKAAAIAKAAGVKTVNIILSETQQRPKLEFRCAAVAGKDAKTALGNEKIKQFKSELKYHASGLYWHFQHQKEPYTGPDVRFVASGKGPNVEAFETDEKKLSTKDIAGIIRAAEKLQIRFSKKPPIENLSLLNRATGEIYPPGEYRFPEKYNYTWYEFDGKPDEGLITGECAGRQYVLLSKKPGEMLPAKGGQLKILRASVGKDSRGKPLVDAELSETDAKALGKLTAANIKRRMAIVVDDFVVSSPIIQGRISKKFQINGDFTIDEAKLLAQLLGSGKEK